MPSAIVGAGNINISMTTPSPESLSIVFKGLATWYGMNGRKRYYHWKGHKWSLFADGDYVPINPKELTRKLRTNTNMVPQVIKNKIKMFSSIFINTIFKNLCKRAEGVAQW